MSKNWKILLPYIFQHSFLRIFQIEYWTCSLTILEIPKEIWPIISTATEMISQHRWHIQEQRNEIFPRMEILLKMLLKFIITFTSLIYFWQEEECSHFPLSGESSFLWGGVKNLKTINGFQMILGKPGVSLTIGKKLLEKLMTEYGNSMSEKGRCIYWVYL